MVLYTYIILHCFRHHYIYYRYNVSDFIPTVTTNGTMKSYTDKCSATYTLPGQHNISINCPDSESSMLVYAKTEAEESIVTEVTFVFISSGLSAL